MKKLIKKLKSAAMKAQLSARNFVSDERGDTNFISIAIILIVIISIAIVFIAFRDQILGKLQQAINDLMNAF